MSKKLRKQINELHASYRDNKQTIEHRLAQWQSSCPAHVNRMNNLKNHLESLLDRLMSVTLGEGHDALFERQFNEASALMNELQEGTRTWWQKLADSTLFLLLVVFLIRTFIFGLYYVPTGSAEPNLLVGDRIFGNKTAYYFSPIKRGDQVIFDDPEFRYAPKGTFTYYWQKYAGIGIPLLGLKPGPQAFTKRVVGIPGDIIEGKIEAGKPVLYRNGVKLDEPWINQLPLIGVVKTLGLIPSSFPLAKILPDMLVQHKMKYPVWYTFDPSKSLDQQPYYKLEQDELYLNRFTKQPMFREAGEPDYYDSFMKIRIPEGKYWLQGDSRRNSRDCRAWGPVDRSLIHGKAACIMFSVDTEEPFWIFELIKHPIDFWSKKLRVNRFFIFPKNPVAIENQG